MSMTSAQMQELIGADPNFRSLVSIYGQPAVTGGDCSTKKPGDICMESDCVDGKKIVMRCDESGDCTVYEEVPC